MTIAKSLGVALITGASQGIGKPIAMRLASDGFKVALNDLNNKKEQLEAVARDIEKQGQASFVVPADVSQESEVHQMVQSASKTLGGLDVMVANAGIFVPMKSIADLGSSTEDVDDWDKVLRINTRSVFLCYKHASKEMISRKQGGRIIGASSISGSAFSAAYSASKFAVRGLTQSAALELGEHGITVNAYAPGLVDTAMLHGIFNDNPINMTKGRSSYPQAGQPEDIASIVSYLASKESRYITGQTISVNAGMYFD
ncbi:acetoin reductase family protein [Rhodocollybia butyracea]|uniref:Acetoin reductase family protein n=1 Tax=Rhodocollybia butyracea TaxID=206335 RepID=A0A9P5PV78_9AGAR|nr:acetoin reductase family protein [Rhodocollybia butyracea]